MPLFGLVGDIHLETENRDAAVDVLDMVVDGFAAAAVDAVILMGDLVTYSETAAVDRGFLRTVTDAFEPLDVPTRYLLGNHEVENLSRAQVCGLLGQEPYGAFAVEGQDVIYLDSSAPRLSGSRGDLGARQRAWLAETLPGVDDALLFVHHPIHYHSVADSPWWDEYPERAFCGDKKEAGRILDENPNVRTVVNAHLHAHDRTVRENVPHITLEPFARKEPGDGVTGAHALLDTDAGTVTMRTPETDMVSYDI